MRRKRRKTGLCVWMLLFFCLLVCSRAERGYAAEEELSLYAECGYDGYGKFGRNIPFFTEILSAESFQGILRIIVPANDGEENYAYEYPISAEKGKTLTVRGEIPFISNYTTISFEILNEKSCILTKQQAKVNTSVREITELYVGVLSENPDASKAFQGVNIGEYTDSSFPYVKTRAFELEDGDIESFYYGLDCLDIIVIDRQRLARLTDIQKEALYRWVCEGGALIAEGGSGRYIFPEDSYPVTEEIEARPYLWVQTQDVKAGRVGYFNLKVEDMTLMEFAVDNNAIPGSVISKVCPAEVITQIIENDHYYNGEENYRSIEALLNTAMGRKLPGIFIYVLIILIYLVLAGPVVFCVLRKKDKAGLTGVAVSGLAVLFSLLIYLMGTSTRFQEPIIRGASIWTLEGNLVSEEAYIDTKAPNSSPYQLVIKRDYSVQPISSDSHYYYESVKEEAASDDYKIELYQGAEATTVTMRQSAPFESQYFSLKREREDADLPGLDADLKYFNEKVRGTVSNGTKKDFEDVVLVLRNGIYILGDMKSGETVNIAGAQKIYFYPDTCGEAANRITGLEKVRYQVNSENPEYAILSQKARLLEYYLKQIDTASETDGILLAFLSPAAAGEFQAGEGYPVYGATLVNKAVSLDTTSGGLLYQNLTANQIINIDEDISYREETGSTYSTSIRLQYNLGNLEGLQAVRFALAEVEQDNPDYQAFSGEVYFYNPLTLAYEQVDLSSGNFWIRDIGKYLMGRDGEYSLIVQYSSELMDTGQYKEIILPLVSVIRKR